MGFLPYFCGKDCGGDACPLLAEVEAGRVVGMHHNPAAGQWIRACGKGMRAHIEHYSPNRITKPLVRRGPRGSGDFVEASWDEALALVAHRLSEIRAESGPGAVMSIASAGSTGALHNTEVLALRFLNAIGGAVHVSGNYSSNAANYALARIFGASVGETGFDPASTAFSNLIVLWGANPLEARLGAELPSRLVEAKKRGSRIVAIDPRYSRSARGLGAEWIPVRPGTDPALGYALLYEIVNSPQYDHEYVAERAEGFDALVRFVLGEIDGIPKSPKWAAPICGIEESMICRLAHLWWQEQPVMLIPGYSIQRVEYGEEAFRLTVAIQLATKNSGKLGASSGSINNRLPGITIAKMREIPESIPSETVYSAKVPVLRWADAVLNPQQYGLGKIRMLYSAGGNFLNQGANIQKNIEAFEAVDFAVCHELFLTPTARYSDVVLPAADPFEKEDIGIPWAGDYVLYKPKIFEPEGMARSDFQIFSELAERLGAKEIFTGDKNESQWIAYLMAESGIPDIEAFKQSGFYAMPQRLRSGLDAFFADPASNPLQTKTGKIEFSSPLWTYEMARFWEQRNGAKEDNAAREDDTAPKGNADPKAPKKEQGELSAGSSFKLLTPKVAEFVHSQRGAFPDSAKKARVHMHPEDLALIGATEGAVLCIRNDYGAVLAVARLDANIRRGTIWLEEGAWAEPENGLDPNGSANMLTSDRGTLESTSCIMHGIKVWIELPPGARS
jgi:anaerobic dimethyl sulfoxide reductase subunit A